MKIQQWIQSVKAEDLKSKYAVRTTCMEDWRIRVRIELVAKPGEPAPGVDDLFIGPFKDAHDADVNGRNIALIVRKALGMEKQ